MLTWFSQQEWFNVGANIIQWLSVSAWVTLMWHLWHNRCGAALCVRPGQVPVPGTIHKVCKKHAAQVGAVHGGGEKTC